MRFHSLKTYFALCLGLLAALAAGCRRDAAAYQYGNVSATHLPAVQTGFALSLQSVLTLHSVFASSLLSSSSEQAWNPSPRPKTSEAAKIKRLSNFMFTSKKNDHHGFNFLGRRSHRLSSYGFAVLMDFRISGMLSLSYSDKSYPQGW